MAYSHSIDFVFFLFFFFCFTWWVITLPVENLGCTTKHCIWNWARCSYINIYDNKPTADCRYIHLGTTSKSNRRLTGDSVLFRAVSVVLNNDNRPEPDRTAGQLLVEFWSCPLCIVIFLWVLFSENLVNQRFHSTWIHSLPNTKTKQMTLSLQQNTNFKY